MQVSLYHALNTNLRNKLTKIGRGEFDRATSPGLLSLFRRLRSVWKNWSEKT